MGQHSVVKDREGCRRKPCVSRQEGGGWGL